MQQFAKNLPKNRRFFDIAANLTDQQFGKRQLFQDRDAVVKRAELVGCSHLLIAAGCLQDASHSFELCNKYQNSYLTIGVHPCRATQPYHPQYKSLSEYFHLLQSHAEKYRQKLVAIGQCGLDYDRLNYSSKQQQLQVFPYHFQIAEKFKLPMYLHNRNTGSDFYDIVRKNRDRFSGGVVHSFTGSLQQVKQILQLDLYIGLNGCSFKTQQNLAVLKQIPIDKMMIQTDAPYCQIRASHAGSKLINTKFPTKGKRNEDYVLKGRNQPCKIVQVLQVISKIKEISEQQVAQICFQNSLKLFNCK